MRAFYRSLSVLGIICLWLLPLHSFGAGIVTNCNEQSFRNALNDGGSVTFTNDCAITLTGRINITNQTSIDSGGHKVIISGGNRTRIFSVATNVQFTLAGLTIQNGSNAIGGAIYISNNAVVVVTNCILSGNGAVGTNGVDGENGADDTIIGHGGKDGTSGSTGLGGAIYNLGSLSIFNSTILTNRAIGGLGGNGGNGGNGGSVGGNGGEAGKGAVGFGGGIHNLGTLVLKDCTFSGNAAIGGDGGIGGAAGSGINSGLAGDGGAGAAGLGAGLYSSNAVTILNCTFSDNVAIGGNSADGGNDSGGIGHSGARGADGAGGGVWNAKTLIATNSTFFRNDAFGGDGGNGGSGGGGGDGGNGGDGLGGGLYSKASATIVNCTFSDGGAIGGANGLGGSGPVFGDDGSIGKSRGGNFNNGGSAAAFILKNSIIGTNFFGGGGYGSFTDSGNNLSSDNSINFTQITSKKNTNPKLGAFGNNGGPTETMSLQTNSPALNTGDDLAAPKLDQRGIARTNAAAGIHSDIGAFEFSTDYDAPNFIVQPTNQTVGAGSTVNFSTVATGTAPLYYQWNFNGTNLVGATNSSLTLSNVLPVNAGTYVLVATNFIASRASSPATLTVFSVTLTNLVLSKTNFTFTYNSETGHTYVVEFKNSLTAAAWTPVATNPGTGTPLTNISLTANTTNRFFRVQTK